MVILAVHKLVELVWGVPLLETEKDAGDEEVDTMVDPQGGTLVVLDRPTTPYKGSRQQITILKA